MFSTNTKELAFLLYQKEPLITEEVRDQLEQCLEVLKKRTEHEGPTGKRFYIYKTLMTHVLPLTNVAFDKTGVTTALARCGMWRVAKKCRP